MPLKSFNQKRIYKLIQIFATKKTGANKNTPVLAKNQRQLI